MEGSISITVNHTAQGSGTCDYAYARMLCGHRRCQNRKCFESFLLKTIMDRKIKFNQYREIALYHLQDEHNDGIYLMNVEVAQGFYQKIRKEAAPTNAFKLKTKIFGKTWWALVLPPDTEFRDRIADYLDLPDGKYAFFRNQANVDALVEYMNK